MASNNMTPPGILSSNRTKTAPAKRKAVTKEKEDKQSWRENNVRAMIAVQTSRSSRKNDNDE
eukprot:CAMPEP_0201990982 /NCGR_PEP_ID=MMETSP0904-20121228/93662_1 /ASSEMBLY_ACC=CAM_ASM_000553 /TAXON_ID=420261 /ORGANISM="Thalassiosira antarctica, Strain CCMP982" /LENGTH=61 /DNA_ID=CAMNT_0048545275 /DNA_START=167 /DNA_END=352 /DNA_ORIENTATION=-